MVACTAPEYAISLRHLVTRLQAIGKDGIGENVVDAPSWRGGRTGKAPGMRVHTPETIDVLRLQEHFDASSRRVKCCYRVKKRAEQRTGWNDAQDGLEEA